MLVCVQFARVARDVSAVGLFFDLLYFGGYFRCFLVVLLWLYFGLGLIWELLIRVLYNIFYIFGYVFVRAHILQYRLLKLLAIIVILPYFGIRSCDGCSCSDFFMRIFFLQFWFFNHLPFRCRRVTC